MLTTLAVILWTISLLQAKLTIGFYGLFNGYSATYFVALGSLTMASFILWIDKKEGHGLLLCIHLILFITMLMLTPVLIGSNPVFTNIVYRDIVHTNYITVNNHLNPAQLFYHAWPGFFVFESSLIQISGATGVPQGFILLSSYLLQLLILIPLYIFFSNTIKNPNLSWLPIWIFFLANWTGQLYLEPQGISFFLLAVLFAALTSVRFQQENALILGYSAIIVLILGGLVVTHLLTSIAAILLLIAFWILRTVKLNFVLVLVILVTIWTVFGATFQLNNNLNNLLQHAFSLDSLLSQLTTRLGTPNASHAAINNLRFVFSGVFLVIGLFGILLSRKYREKADRANLFLLLASFTILFSVLYGTEQLMRFYLFALIPLAYFSVKLFKNKITQFLLLGILLLMLPLNIITYYGNAALDYFPSTEIAYSKFLYKTASGEGEIYGGPNLIISGHKYIKLMDIVSTKQTLIEADNKGFSNRLVHIGIIDTNEYDFRYNNQKLVPVTDNLLSSSPSYSVIYSNPELKLYYGTF